MIKAENRFMFTLYWVSAMAIRTLNFIAFSMNLQYQFAMFFFCVILAIVFSSNRVEN